MPAIVISRNDSPALALEPFKSFLAGVRASKEQQQAASLEMWRKWREMMWPHEPVIELTTDWKSVAGEQGDVTDLVLSTLSPRERRIVDLDSTGLLERLHHPDLRSPDRYTAVEVLMACCKVSTIAHAVTNCLTEIFFAEGLARAAELDQYRIDHNGAIVGPLHGLPVSIKDHVSIKGYDSSSGYAAWVNKSVATQDATVVNVYRQAGAVLFVKTANPQTLLSLETNNNIFGRTRNPYNRKLTPGGSSGGEGVLVTVRGSPMGIGTDIGGSIRGPAAHTGLYGLKGSVGRLPHGGLNGTHDGMDAIVGCLGPMTRSARDLSLFCRVMLKYEPWLMEPSLIEMPWKQDLADGVGILPRLSIAVLWDDGVVAPHPPIRNALQFTVDALVAAGHQVISWMPVDHQDAWDLIVKFYFLDGGAEYFDTMVDDPHVPQTEWIMSQVPNGGKPFTMAELFKLSRAREDFRTKIAHLWNKTQEKTDTGRPVDAILCPVAPTLAPPHDGTRWWGYTSYWNLLDYPGVVFPAGRHRVSEYTSLEDRPLRPARNSVEKEVRAQWNPHTYDNSPIGLQLVARRLNEERLLGLLKSVEAATTKYKQMCN
jgi:amidase